MIVIIKYRDNNFPEYMVAKRVYTGYNDDHEKILYCYIADFVTYGFNLSDKNIESVSINGDVWRNNV